MENQNPLYYSYRALLSQLRRVRPKLSKSTLHEWIKDHRCYPFRQNDRCLGYTESALMKLVAVAIATNECQRKDYVRERITSLLQGRTT